MVKIAAPPRGGGGGEIRGGACKLRREAGTKILIFIGLKCNVFDNINVDVHSVYQCEMFQTTSK